MDFVESVPSIWHAFNALDSQNDGKVAKSQLKVLTFQIANHVGVKDVEKSIDDYRSLDFVTFADYCNFLKVAVFNSIEETDQQNNTTNMDEIHKNCWYICSHNYLHNRDNKLLSDNDIFKLWQVFNFLCETEENGDVEFPVVMHTDELWLLVESFLRQIKHDVDKDSYLELTDNTVLFTFPAVLKLFEDTYCSGLDVDTIKVVLSDFYEDYIEQVVKKGFLTKGEGLNKKTRYFVLLPKMFHFYTGRDRSYCKGTITFTAEHRVRSLSDTKMKNKFHLVTPSKTYDLTAEDVRDKTLWMNALDVAIKNCNNPYSPKKKELLKRKLKRRETLDHKRKEEQSKLKTAEELSLTKEELEEKKRSYEKLKLEMEEERDRLSKMLADLKQIEQERQRVYNELQDQTNQRELDQQKLAELDQEREELNTRLLEEASVQQALKRRVQELADMQEELKKQRDEAERAKRDEEIVRGLQAVALREELEKREELERLQAELQENYEEVQQRAKGQMMEVQAQQKQMVRELEEQLEQLQIDRIEKDKQLQESTLTLKDAEEARADLEKKLQEKEKEQKEHSLSNKLAKMLGLDLESPFMPGTHRGKDFEQVVEKQVAYHKQRVRHGSAPPPVPTPRTSLIKTETSIKQTETSLKQTETSPVMTDSCGESEDDIFETTESLQEKVTCNNNTENTSH